MRKLVCIALLTASCSQQVHSQSRIGLVGGSLYAKSNLTDQNQSGVRYQSSSTFGNIYSFYGGIVYDIKVTNEFSVKSKLLLINKGWTETKSLKRDTVNNISMFNVGQVNIPIESVKTKELYKFNYLELPINFTFYTPLGKSMLSFGVGPYISVGLSGKYSFNALYSNRRIVEQHTTNRSYSFTDTVRYGGVKPDDIIKVPFQQTITEISIRDTSNYLVNTTYPLRFEGSKNNNAVYTANKFDFGSSIEASVALRMGLNMNITYTAGFTNVLKEHYGALQNRHRIIMLGLGYYIKTRKGIANK